MIIFLCHECGSVYCGALINGESAETLIVTGAIDLRAGRGGSKLGGKWQMEFNIGKCSILRAGWEKDY